MGVGKSLYTKGEYTNIVGANFIQGGLCSRDKMQMTSLGIYSGDFLCGCSGLITWAGKMDVHAPG